MKPSNQKHRRVFDGLQNQQKKRDFTKQNVGPISLLRVGIYLFVCLTFCSLVGLGVFGARTANATAGINQEMSFQGKIVSSTGQNIPDGTYNMQFRIYTGCTNEPTNNTGCTAVWTEDYLKNNTQGVTFTSGTYQVNLGSLCAFTTSTCQNNSNTAVDWNSYPLYLSLQIGSGSSNCSPNNPGATNFQADCGGDGEMNPYVLLTSTPYAFNSNELGGLTASQFGQLSATQTWTGANTIQDSATNAFVVQDASSNNMLAITTTGTYSVGVGATGSTAVATTVNVGTSTGAAQTVTLGSTASSSTTTVQGGTSGVALTTGAGSGTTGSVSITTGNSSGGTSGSITIDAGTNVPSGTLAGSKTFEVGRPDSGLEDMTCWFGSCSTVATSSAQAHQGSKSLAMTESGGGSWGMAEDYPGDTSVTPGHTYTFTAWVRGTTAEDVDVEMVWAGISSVVLDDKTDSTSAWTEWSGTFVAPAGATNVYFTFRGAGGGGTDYFDDFTITDISSTTAPAINIGTANAEAVSIGNSSQSAATSLMGGAGGVNIVAGSGAGINVGTSSDNIVTIGDASADWPITLQGNGISQTLTGDDTTPSDVIATSTDSTAALVVKDSGDNPILNVDTANNIVEVGSQLDTVGNTALNIANGNATSVNIGNSGLTNATTIYGTAAVQTYHANSATAFQVQNTNGYAALTADTSNGLVALGTGSHVNGKLVLNNSTNGNTVAILSGVTSSSYTLTMPTSLGASGSCLSDTGSGVLGWATCGGGGGGANTALSNLASVAINTDLQFDNTGNRTVNIAATGAGTAGRNFTVQAGNSGTGAVNGGNLTLQAGASGGSGTTGSVIVKANGTDSTTAFQLQNASGNAVLTADTSGGLVALGKASSVNGKLVLNNSSNSNTVAILSGVTSSSYSLTMPTALGASGSCLSDTTGTGTLGWATCGGGGGANTALSNLASVAINTDLQFANTGNRTINIAAAGAGTAGKNLTVQAGNSGTGAVNGGNLVLQAGATGGSGTTGSVIVKANGTNSTSAFQVQNSSGNPVLNVDTTDQQVAIGQTSSSTAAPLLTLTQSSTGDADMLYTNTNTSNGFAVGINTSDSDSFNINSTTSAGGTGTTTTAGVPTGDFDSTSDNGNNGILSGTEIQANATGTVTTLRVHIAGAGGGSHHMQVGLYTNDPGGAGAGAGYDNPGTLLGNSSSVTLTTNNQWYNFTIPSTSVTSGTKYWIAFNSDSSAVNYSWAIVGDGAINDDWSNAVTFGSWSGNANPWSSQGGGDDGNGYAVNMDIVTAGTITDEFSGSLFKVTQLGAATFENYSNSTTAFQIQNNSGYNVLGADTSDGWAILGTSSHVNGEIVFNNSTNTNTISILSGVTSTAYTLTLPTAGSTSGSCLQSGSGSTTAATNLTWGSCGGGGGGTQTVTLAPEYPGAVFHASGSSNQGYMQSDYDTTNNHNFYEWSTDQASQQSYDIVERYQVPTGYTSYDNLKVWTYVDSTTGTAATVTLKDGATSCGTTTLTPGSASTWTQTTLTNTCTFAANDVLTFDFTLKSTGTSTVWTKLGELSFQYN